MANFITASRLILLLLVIFLVYFGSPLTHLLNVFLLILVFVSDGLDGYIARKRNETSLFGAVFDIAADRIVELCLWVVFVDIAMVPVWIPLVFIARGIMTDSIRTAERQTKTQDPFEITESRVARILVSGRFIRGFYATIKAIAFCLLMLALSLRNLLDTDFQIYVDLVHQTGLLLSYVSVVICLLRGIPVIVEFIQKNRS
jgi:CDP-diacylglycerol--glycerol-3-phosphate 3-phosphatidyltransferase